MGKFESLSLDDLREHMSAIAGGPSHHSLTEGEVSELLAEGMVRLMEQLESPKPKPKRRAPKQKSPPAAP